MFVNYYNSSCNYSNFNECEGKDSIYISKGDNHFLIFQCNIINNSMIVGSLMSYNSLIKGENLIFQLNSIDISSYSTIGFITLKNCLTDKNFYDSIVVNTYLCNISIILNYNFLIKNNECKFINTFKNIQKLKFLFLIFHFNIY